MRLVSWQQVETSTRRGTAVCTMLLNVEASAEGESH